MNIQNFQSSIHVYANTCTRTHVVFGDSGQGFVEVHPKIDGQPFEPKQNLGKRFAVVGSSAGGGGLGRGQLDGFVGELHRARAVALGTFAGGAVNLYREEMKAEGCNK